MASASLAATDALTSVMPAPAQHAFCQQLSAVIVALKPKCCLAVRATFTVTGFVGKHCRVAGIDARRCVTRGHVGGAPWRAPGCALAARWSMRGWHVTRRLHHVGPHATSCCHVGGTGVQSGVTMALAPLPAEPWSKRAVPVGRPSKWFLAMKPSGAKRNAATSRIVDAISVVDAAVMATAPHVTCHVARGCPVGITSALPHAIVALVCPAP